MSDERIEALRRVYDEWAKGNRAAGGELLAPDVHVTWQVAPGEMVSHGREELGRNLRDFMAQWDDWVAVAESFTAMAENAVLVDARVSMRGKTSGVLVEAPMYSAWIFDGDVVTHVHWHFDRDEVLAWLEQRTKRSGLTPG